MVFTHFLCQRYRYEGNITVRACVPTRAIRDGHYVYRASCVFAGPPGETGQDDVDCVSANALNQPKFEIANAELRRSKCQRHFVLALPLRPRRNDEQGEEVVVLIYGPFCRVLLHDQVALFSVFIDARGYTLRY